MFEYTCPTCQTTMLDDDLQSEDVCVCQQCGQQLRVHIKAEDRAPTPGLAHRAALRVAALALLVGGCGIVGLTLAAVIVSGTFFLGDRSATPSKATQVAASEPQSPPRPSTGEEDKTKKLDKKEPDKKEPDKKEPDKKETVKKEPDKKEADKKAPDKKEPDKKETVKREEADPLLPPPALSPEEVDKRLLKSAVWILILDEEKGKVIGSGSGFLVDTEHRLVMTNHHVAGDKGKRTLVVFPQYKKENGELIGESKYYVDNFKEIALAGTCVRPDTLHDLALIQLDRLPKERPVLALPFAKQSPLRQQQIFAMGGKPDGTEAMWNIKDGKVTGSALMSRPNETPPFEATVVESSIPINHGNSGGPTVDTHCRLVAISERVIRVSSDDGRGHLDGHIGSAHIDVRHARALMQDYFEGTLHEKWKEPENEALLGNTGLQVLIKRLKSGDKSVRKQSVLALGALDSDARQAVPDLLQVLREDVVEENRAAALKALNQIGPPYKEFIAVLIAALPDKAEVRARRYAADALGRLGPDARATAHDLLGALKDADADVRRNAATALGQIGSAVREEASPALLDHLRDPQREVRLAAQTALLRLGKSTLDLTALQKRLQEPNASAEERFYIVRALADCGPDSVSTLAKVLVADEKEVRIAFGAAMALGLLKVRNEEVSAGLGKALDHKEAVVRVRAMQSIRDLGPDGPLMPAFLKALCCPDAEVRRLAIQALPNITVFLKEAPTLTLKKDSLEGLKKALASPEPAARWFAAFGLGSLGVDAAPAAPNLRAALLNEKLTDPKVSPVIRLEILAALASIGPSLLTALGTDASKFLDELLEIATDTNEDSQFHRTCAALALVQVALDKPQGKAALPVLIVALRLNNFDKPNVIDAELHERAKKALVKAPGIVATDPKVVKELRVLIADQLLEKGLKRTFALSPTPEAQQTALEKMIARKVTFQVLGSIGPAASSTNLKAYILATLKNPREHQNVRDAARAADGAIFSK